MIYNKPFDQTNPAAGYVNGNPATNTAGSIPCAEGLEYPQREIVATITAAGLTPTNGDLTQLSQAIPLLAKAVAATYVTNNFAKGSLIARRVFSTPGTTTYTPTSGTNKVRVTVVGGGGGGSAVPATNSSQFAVGGGGGAGGVAISDIASGFAGVPITVGAGGGRSGAGAAAAPGNASSFGSILSATGGQGGTVTGATANPYSNAGGVGGVGSGGNVFTGNGGAGANGVAFNSNNISSGNGGASYIGAGAPSIYTTSAAGQDATTAGAGGGGAAAQASTGGYVGGAGGTGIVIVEEYA